MPSTTIKIVARYSIIISNEEIQKARLSKRYGIWTSLEIAIELAKLKICNGKVSPAWIDVDLARRSRK